METIRNWNGLEKYGIVPLTGEACNLSMRLLCDLTLRGKRIVEAVFSTLDMKTTFTLPQAWNGSVIRLTGGEAPEERATTAIMLPTDLWRTLAVFCLIDAGASDIYLAEEKPVIGVFVADYEEFAQRHGEHAEATFDANIRYIYGESEYEGAKYLCARHIRVPGKAGHRNLLNGTRNTHAMSERTL